MKITALLSLIPKLIASRVSESAAPAAEVRGGRCNAAGEPWACSALATQPGSGTDPALLPRCSQGTMAQQCPVEVGIRGWAQREHPAGGSASQGSSGATAALTPAALPSPGPEADGP